MKGFVLASLLAGAHGLGNTWPYVNLGGALHASQTIAPWITGVCTTGSNQSPIDIVKKKTKYPKTDPGVPKLSGFGNLETMTVKGGANYAATLPPTEITMHSITFASTPTLTGGPFDPWSSYSFHFAEFHWGDTDTEGSEHSIDGDHSPLEMNMVFTKQRHTITAVSTIATSFSAAVTAATTAKDESGLAAISFQFEADTTDNADIEAVIVAYETLAEASLATTPVDTLVALMFNVSNLISPDDKDLLEDYYYYDGSLTLPVDAAATVPADSTLGCAEIVRWIVPTEKLKIGNAQLARLRAMQTPGGTVLRRGVGGAHTNNARAVQTNGNDVYYRKNSKKDDSMAKVLASSLLSIGTFGVIQGFLNQPDTAKALIDNPVVHALQDLEQSIFNSAPTVAAREANHHHHPQEIHY